MEISDGQIEAVPVRIAELTDVAHKSQYKMQAH
jgi:hypothetical protein